MARYEIAVRKVIATFDNPKTDFNYEAKDLINLIEDIFVQHENVHNLLMRKLYQ